MSQFTTLASPRRSLAKRPFRLAPTVVGLLALGMAGLSHAATSEVAGARPGACASLVSKRFVFEVQGRYDTGYNALPFAEVGRLVFDASGPTGTSSGYNNGPGETAAHPSTSFACSDLALPRGFAQLAFADGRTYQLIANNAANSLKMIRVDANYYAGGEAKLSTDWSTLPAQACTLLKGKNYMSFMVGSILVTTPASGAYSAFADLWSFTTTPGKLSGVWEFGANSPSYHAESGTLLDCTPYDDGAAIVTWVTPQGQFENGFAIYPNADGSAAAVVSTIPGQGAAGWLVKR